MPLRIAATLLIVLAVTAGVGVMGPQLSAVPATFPAITSVIVPFTHARGAAAAVMHVLRGMLLSHLAFAMLLAVAAAPIPLVGIVSGHALAFAAALITSGTVIAADRSRARQAIDGAAEWLRSGSPCCWR
jgi:hypothetical protein